MNMTVYANLVDGELKGVYDLLPSTWNGVNNFNIKSAEDEVFMTNSGFVKIVRDRTLFDPTTDQKTAYEIAK